MERYTNKRMMFRSGGRFRKATMADVGLGSCSVCGGITQRVYDGDPNDPFPDPRNFRFRCFSCEPEVEARNPITAETAINPGTGAVDM